VFVRSGLRPSETQIKSYLFVSWKDANLGPIRMNACDGGDLFQIWGAAT